MGDQTIDSSARAMANAFAADIAGFDPSLAAEISGLVMDGGTGTAAGALDERLDDGGAGLMDELKPESMEDAWKEAQEIAAKMGAEARESGTGNRESGGAASQELGTGAQESGQNAPAKRSLLDLAKEAEELGEHEAARALLDRHLNGRGAAQEEAATAAVEEPGPEEPDWKALRSELESSAWSAMVDREMAAGRHYKRDASNGIEFGEDGLPLLLSREEIRERLKRNPDRAEIVAIKVDTALAEKRQEHHGKVEEFRRGQERRRDSLVLNRTADRTLRETMETVAARLAWEWFPSVRKEVNGIRQVEAGAPEMKRMRELVDRVMPVVMGEVVSQGYENDLVQYGPMERITMVNRLIAEHTMAWMERLRSALISSGGTSGNGAAAAAAPVNGAAHGNGTAAAAAGGVRGAVPPSLGPGTGVTTFDVMTPEQAAAALDKMSAAEMATKGAELVKRFMIRN